MVAQLGAALLRARKYQRLAWSYSISIVLWDEKLVMPRDRKQPRIEATVTDVNASGEEEGNNDKWWLR